MKRSYISTTGVLLLSILGAPAALGQPRTEPVAYEAVFTIPEGTLTGTASLAIGPDGLVSGTFEVPADGVAGTLSGTVTKAVWTVRMTYTMAGRACDGLVTGKAQVSSDKAKISGDVTIGGSCTTPEKPGQFVFTKKR